MGGLQPAGLVGHGEEFRFYPKDHGEPLERLEVVCFCRLTLAATQTVGWMGTGWRQGGHWRLLQSSCEMWWCPGSGQRRTVEGQGDGRLKMSLGKRIYRTWWMVAGGRLLAVAT